MTNEVSGPLCNAGFKAVFNCVNANESLWQAVRGWLVAGGTLGAVFVAIFSSWIRSFFKARLKYNVTSEPPHFMYDNEVGLLWLEIANDSRVTDARFVRISIVDVYIRQSMGEAKSFERKWRMHPCPMIWSGLPEQKNAYVHIAAKTSEFALLLRIRCHPVVVGNNPTLDGNNPGIELPPTIEVAYQGRVYQVEGDFQDIIIKVRISGNTVKTEIKYFRVNWQGRNVIHLRDGASKFLISKPIDEKTAIRMIKEI